MTEFQALAAATALRKLLHGSSYFSICELDTIAKLMGKDIGGPDYTALHALHCVHWANMPPGLPAKVRDKVYEMLGLPEAPIEHADHAAAPTHEETPPKRGLRLAFWK